MMPKISSIIFLVIFFAVLFADYLISKGHNCRTIEKLARMTDSEDYIWMNKYLILRMRLIGDIAFCPILGTLCCIIRGLILLGLLIAFAICLLTQNVIIFIICSLILAALFFLEVYAQNYIKLEIVWYYVDKDLMRDMKYHSDVTFVPFNVYDKALGNIIKEKEKEEEIKKEVSKKHKKCPICGSYMDGYECPVCGYKH